MHDVSVAFLWHQHQPYYPDDATGQIAMPWVRLHAAKDYWGMAMHLLEVPEVHASINLVPSLVTQLQAYSDGALDQHLQVSRTPADALSEAERLYLLDNFFMASLDQMIRPHPRYHELYLQRGLGVDTAARALRRFSNQDLLDLQCWSNLAWFHPIAFERDAELEALRQKGRHFTEQEKQWLLDHQLELLNEVIPLHRQLAARGQVELTTTPFYHPILPLLFDKRLAREAMPQVNLPSRLEGYAEDAAAQVARAVEFHTRVFGVKPRGMWPSEGSVCQAIIPLLAAAGIAWIASDEEILAHSTGGRVSRDGQGFVQHPELLYRPWAVEEQGQRLQMIFRDHALSDLIGFQYQRVEAKHAADDMIGKLEAIGRAVGQHGGAPPLVSVILDGENCWEYYPNGGVDFLRALYRRLASHPRLKAVRVSDHLTRHPASERLGRLFAGSWISHNFSIWIGHPATNRAWDLLSEARAVLVQQTSLSASATIAEEEGVSGTLPPQLARAWEELYIAEGSDWFWWFDDKHTSGQDWLFDQLFRRHLQNVYRLLGLEVPPALDRPIADDRDAAQPFQQPTDLLGVRVDGRETYFEWLNAGTCEPSAARGTMTMAEAPRVERLSFGFDAKRLLVRLDAPGGIARGLADVEAMRIVFVEPAGYELRLTRPASRKPRAQLFKDGQLVHATGIQSAAEAILEVAVPLRWLTASAGDALRFFVELLAGEVPSERIPLEGAVETIVPSPDFELMMWRA